MVWTGCFQTWRLLLLSPAACLHPQPGLGLREFLRVLFCCLAHTHREEESKSEPLGLEAGGWPHWCFFVSLAVWRGSLTWEDKEPGQVTPPPTLRAAVTGMWAHLRWSVHSHWHGAPQSQRSKCGSRHWGPGRLILFCVNESINI